MDFIAFQNAVQLNGGIIPEHLKDVARKFRGEQDAAVMGAEAAAATASDQIIDALDAHPEIVRAVLADNGIDTAEDASEETLRELLSQHGDLPELAAIIAEALDTKPADDAAATEGDTAEDASEETPAPDFDAMNRVDLIAFTSLHELDGVNTRSNVKDETIREQVREAWTAKQEAKTNG